MCGIAGIISSNKNIVARESLQKMATALQHRGPDGEGFFINADNTVGFAHRRLSIIDLSNNAAQPFQSLHLTIIFNGEIYNYLEIKDFLSKKGFAFSTQSDTEVIAAAYCFWGKDCLNEFDGMFSLAIYDEKAKEVFLARDRFGEKPCYYHLQKTNESFDFFFASEMKALWSIGLEKQVNNTQLLNYLTLGYAANPASKAETFYSNIQSLPPSHYALINVQEKKFEVFEWYNTKAKVKSQNPEVEIANSKFLELFSSSIQKRLRSDVAVGTSLSGGIDSSSIVAVIYQLANKNNYQPQTFTASFPGFDKDETQYSQAVANYLQLQQHLVTPTAGDLVNRFQQLMYHQEEPLQSSSVFTQFMVYELAKQKGITVLLDGQGADEILGGYKKYTHWFLQELLRQNFIKFKQEKALLKANDFLESWTYKNYFAAFLPKITAKQLQVKAMQQQQENGFINKDFFLQYQNKESLQKPVIESLSDILYYNSFVFGLEELLRYADRNSMAHGREVRLPFLNHQLVEFVFSLPSSFKINNGYTKWILRESVKNFLPDNIAWRKGKTGYEPPQQEWMKHPAIVEMIREARKKLITINVLDKKIIATDIAAMPAHAADNFDWKILCAANLL